MPTQHLTDTWIKKAPYCDKPTWYTDKRFPGLRLQITKSTKTFHATKWDATERKTRTKKLGQFTPNQNLGWAKKQVAEFSDAVEEGSAATTRAEKREAEMEAARNRPPTLIEAMDAFLDYRSVDRSTIKKMSQATATKYRRAIENHLAEWKDKRIDELDAPAIRAHLDRLQGKMAHAAMYTHNALGCCLRHYNKTHYATLLVPGLSNVTPTTEAEVDTDVALYAKRWAEIEAKHDPVEAAMWKVRWLSGIRVEALRKMKWDDINWDMRTVYIGPDKRYPARTIPLADVLFDLLYDVKAMDRPGEYVFATTIPGRRVRLRRDPKKEINVARHMRHLFHDASMACFVHDIIHDKLAGQKNSSIRAHYGNVDMETLRDAANKIAKWIVDRTETSVSDTVVDLKRSRA